MGERVGSFGGDDDSGVVRRGLVKLMVARATKCLGFFEFEFSLKASVHNGLVCLIIILVCMLQIVCSVL